MAIHVLLTREERRYLCKLESVVVDYEKGLAIIPTRFKNLEYQLFQELLDKAFHATSAGMIPLALKILRVAEQKAETAFDLHRCYRQAIDSAYRGREDEFCLKVCIDYCYKDIENWPNLKKENNNLGSILLSRPYKRLAIIYEKLGDFEKAIHICELSVRLGLSDSTISGFTGRLEKLKLKALIE